MKALIFALVIALFITLFIISVTNQDTKENFISRRSWRPRRYRHNFRNYNYRRFCSECDSKTLYGCNNCINCGLCYDEYGHIDCVPGSTNGPYFRKDCKYWIKN